MLSLTRSADLHIKNLVSLMPRKYSFSCPASPAALFILVCSHAAVGLGLWPGSAGEPYLSTAITWCPASQSLRSLKRLPFDQKCPRSRSIIHLTSRGSILINLVDHLSDIPTGPTWNFGALLGANS